MHTNAAQKGGLRSAELSTPNVPMHTLVWLLQLGQKPFLWSSGVLTDIPDSELAQLHRIPHLGEGASHQTLISPTPWNVQQQ